MVEASGRKGEWVKERWGDGAFGDAATGLRGWAVH